MVRISLLRVCSTLRISYLAIEMNSRRSIIATLFLITILNGGCLDIFSSGGGSYVKIHYVAIDIDDVFLSPNSPVDVKMNAGDVMRLLELTNKIGSSFGSDFKFSLGYNYGYFDITNPGDLALIEHAGDFVWFDHLPRHEHVKENSLSTEKIENLMAESAKFEKSKGISPHVSKTYMITPKNEGTWPPYEPLYESFKKFGILYTANSNIKSTYEYEGVRVFPRTLMGIGSSKHSAEEVSRGKILSLARWLYYELMINDITLIGAHQANFTDNRPAEKIFEELIPMLLANKNHKFIFLPAEKAIEAYLNSQE